PRLTPNHFPRHRRAVTAADRWAGYYESSRYSIDQVPGVQFVPTMHVLRHRLNVHLVAPSKPRDAPLTSAWQEWLCRPYAAIGDEQACSPYPVAMPRA